MNASPVIPTKTLVLLGGGHAHAGVLRSFGMMPPAQLRVVLVSETRLTPYSGMLPGLVAGHYSHEEAHLDLRALARFANADYCEARVQGLDLEHRRLTFSDRPPIGFDLLSVNIGSTPDTHGIPGSEEFALPVKPIHRFLKQWDLLVAQVQADPGRQRHVVVIGGGAGGVELTLATQARLLRILNATRTAPDRLQFTLISKSAELLPTHPARVRNLFARVLASRQVRLRTQTTVKRIDAEGVHCGSGERIEADHIFVVTDASAQPWIRESGLAVDAAGFLAVDTYLRSVSHPFVFAAGDVAALTGQERPKAGVFAVRQGMPLSINLRRAATGHPLEPYRAQSRFLSLITTGDKYAVLSRAPWVASGAWLWHVKDWIDRRWMRQYQKLPAMRSDPRTAVDSATLSSFPSTRIDSGLRCGGCGAKVGAGPLAAVLKRLDISPHPGTEIGLEHPDDAAVLTAPPGCHLVQTVDFFRTMINDPYLFGRIAATHALSDIFAMGTRPTSALAIATIPPGAPRVVEELLFQLLSGVVDVLRAEGVHLVGGHTSEGQELACGLSVQGWSSGTDLLRKGGLRGGNALILTKGLGTGAILAAEMRGRASPEALECALRSMQHSNGAALPILKQFGATAATDVTGFGLAGHVCEMLAASGLMATLALDQVPLLAGAAELFPTGIESSLAPENRTLEAAIQHPESARARPAWPFLFDPQTSGGLLAGIPADQAEECVRTLREAGYPQATRIGTVRAHGERDGSRLRIVLEG